MLIRELVLHNFGGYRGRQVIDLAPASDTQPIVLFGGLNGAGKTTLLDALQLVLYGKRARCAGRGTLGYDEYLRRCIHRGVAGREGAALEIRFDATFDEQTTEFRVSRSWDSTPTGAVREHLLIETDGALAPLLAERWDETVEEIMPLEISSLFFFDGEKIEALADPERAGRVIGTAVDTLLGLNLLDRLSVDLVALERRKRAAGASEIDTTKIAEAEAALAAVTAEREARLHDAGDRLNELDRAEVAFANAEAAFKRDGGELYEHKTQLEQRRHTLEAQRGRIADELIELASGSLPLRLVPDLLNQVVAQRERQAEAGRAAAVLDTLTDRDDELLRTFKADLPDEMLQRLTNFLDEDRALRTGATAVDAYLHGPGELDERLAGIVRGGLDAAAAGALKLLAARVDVEGELELVERQLAAVPSAEAIAAAVRERDRAMAALVEARTRHEIADELLDEATRKVDNCAADLDRAYRRAAATLAGEADSARVVEHAERVRATVATFREQLLERHLSGIETAVLDSLRRLLRKERLVDDLRIDPTTFAVSLLDSDGNAVPAERLSAGERQLLAVGLLWGLARVSGRSLPAVIDTPLGRLDGTHRRLLAERYFPQASHQVLLLSTDEEIDEGLLDVLRPAIGRTYELAHDDAAGATTVRPGYFFAQEATHVA